MITILDETSRNNLKKRDKEILESIGIMLCSYSNIMAETYPYFDKDFREMLIKTLNFAFVEKSSYVYNISYKGYSYVFDVLGLRIRSSI